MDSIDRSTLITIAGNLVKPDIPRLSEGKKEVFRRWAKSIREIVDRNATAREARLVEALEFVIAKGTGHLGGCRCDACQIFDEATAALAEYRGDK